MGNNEAEQKREELWITRIILGNLVTPPNIKFVSYDSQGKEREKGTEAFLSK